MMGGSKCAARGIAVLVRLVQRATGVAIHRSPVSGISEVCSKDRVNNVIVNITDTSFMFSKILDLGRGKLSPANSRKV